jgi:hypothetical protein
MSLQEECAADRDHGADRESDQKQRPSVVCHVPRGFPQPGLGIKLPTSEPGSATHGLRIMDLVTVAVYNLVPEAHLAKNLLEAEDIPAFLDEDAASDMLHLTSGIKLQVAAQSAEQARAILDAAERHEFTADSAHQAEEHSKDPPADVE